MFDHSIKVPRLYKKAAKIAKDVVDGKGSIKQLVYEGKHPNIKALYALVVQTFQKSTQIEDLLKKSKLLTKEPRFDPFLAKILITELLWGKQRLMGDSKPVKTILAYEQILKAHMSDSTDEPHDFQQVDKPRYVRVNTLLLPVTEAIDKFRDEGWILKRYTDKNDYPGFLEAVASLGYEEFMVDIHITDLLIFPPKTQFYQHPAYKNGSLILQDKASCLPVHILNPEPGSCVLDMCAAPGMKTTQTAARIQDQGVIYATEVKQKRFETLNQIVESSGATCVKTINQDVLTLTHKDCPDVKYILVDPSCSGSGITDRVEVGAQKQDEDPERLEKLAGFQIKVLRHALTKFHKAQRVVYSTCSNYPEENEDVVRQVLETCYFFKLVPASRFVNDVWINFGSPEFGDIGKYCLYARPEMDLTNGFFVAVFERVGNGEVNPFLNFSLLPFSLQRKGKVDKLQRGDELETEGQKFEEQSTGNLSKSENEEMECKKKKKKESEDTEIVETVSQSMKEEGKRLVDEEENELKGESIKEKRKSKRRIESAEIGSELENDSQRIKKKRKKYRDEIEPVVKTEDEEIYGKKKKKKKATEIVKTEPVELETVSQSMKEGGKRFVDEEENELKSSVKSENIKEKKKSKRRIESDELEDDNQRIKKKRNKYRDEIEPIVKTETESVENEHSHKKKKKKKTKKDAEDLESNMIDVKIEPEVVECNNQKVKKKIKKEGNGESVVKAELESTENEKSGEKKKRKKKSKDVIYIKTEDI